MGAKKILLVDDDRDFVELNRLLLEGSGYAVTTAHSGAEGREKALECLPDLVVLDVMMETDHSGFETARWLREHDATKQAPIIMLTAVNQESSVRFGPDDVWLPVDEFLEKPVSSDRLLAEIRDKLPLE